MKEERVKITLCCKIRHKICELFWELIRVIDNKGLIKNPKWGDKIPFGAGEKRLLLAYLYRQLPPGLAFLGRAALQDIPFCINPLWIRQGITLCLHLLSSAS